MSLAQAHTMQYSNNSMKSRAMIDIKSWRKYQVKLRRSKKNYARRRKVTGGGEQAQNRRKKSPSAIREVRYWM